MSKLQVRIDGDDIVACEDAPDNIYGWVYVTTHIYTNDMMLWCGERNLVWGRDMNIQTYRLKGRPLNSHRWYFKDPEVATLFALMFS
jgi:hypothetical protein